MGSYHAKIKQRNMGVSHSMRIFHCDFRSLTNYCASLAHKTNHSFIPNCEFGEFHHPRFGLVPCLQAIHSIAAGEEIFVWYGYELDYCPAWYMDAWARGQYLYRTEKTEGLILVCISQETLLSRTLWRPSMVCSELENMLSDTPLMHLILQIVFLCKPKYCCSEIQNTNRFLLFILYQLFLSQSLIEKKIKFTPLITFQIKFSWFL